MTDIVELLSAYLDDELDDGERKQVDDALGASAELRKELAELEHTRSLLRGLPEVEPRRPVAVPALSTPSSSRRTRRLAVAVTAVAAVWLVILTVGVRIGSLPVVPEVDQLALQHAAAQGDGADMGFQPMTADQMADDPAVFDDLGHGMAREAIFQSDDIVHVRYSDGIHAVSVFHQPGKVDWDDMPDMGSVEMMDDEPVWTSTMNDVEVLVAERGDLIVTVVADGDMDHEMTMMASSMVPEVDMDDGFWSTVMDAPGNILDRLG